MEKKIWKKGKKFDFIENPKIDLEGRHGVNLGFLKPFFTWERQINFLIEFFFLLSLFWI